jgi:hypothetical protein
MGERFSAPQGFLTATHRVSETAFVLEVSRNDVPHQFAWIASLLGRGVRQLRLKFGREMNFHSLRIRQSPVSGKSSKQGRPTFDTSPYFFNAVHLSSLGTFLFSDGGGSGNIIAILFLVLFMVAAIILVMATIILPGVALPAPARRSSEIPDAVRA